MPSGSSDLRRRLSVKGGACAVLLLLGLMTLVGCARLGLNQGEPASAPRLAGAEVLSGHAVLSARQAESLVTARPASREGPGGYQRTSVPPGFLVLMLGVPLLILLL